MLSFTSPIPLRAARTVALHAQLLAEPPVKDAPPPDRERIAAVIEHLGALQIDTLQMVQRSHYLALWSRLGTYDTADLDALAYGSDRRFFEYWWHAACYVPLADYRYTLLRKRQFREHPGAWHTHWLAEPGAEEILTGVLARIEQEGGLRAGNFDGRNRGPWWGWKPAKHALEMHFNQGTLMIANRVNFQRVYDLAPRVLPDWVDTTEPSPEETRRFQAERAIRAFGICEPLHAANYVHMNRSTIRPAVEALLAEGVILPLEVAGSNGRTRTMAIHRANLPALEAALDGTLVARRTTFLSPFDSLFWPINRDEQLWGFEQTLEAYLPAPRRRWGYFCLPILHEDRLVGRLDPKLDRKMRTLTLRALFLEPGITPDEQLITGVAGAMRDFLRFHEATGLVIERSDPAEFGPRLLAAL